MIINSKHNSLPFHNFSYTKTSTHLLLPWTHSCIAHCYWLAIKKDDYHIISIMLRLTTICHTSMCNQTAGDGFQTSANHSLVTVFKGTLTY